MAGLEGIRPGHAAMADREPTPAPTDTLMIGLLLDIADYHVHAVRRPADPYPRSECGLNVVPGIYRPGPVLLCHDCPDATDWGKVTAIYAASTVRRRLLDADLDDHAGLILKLNRRYLAWQYDRRIIRDVKLEVFRRIIAREVARRGDESG